MSLFAELKRRNVIKVAGAYLALAWVVVQATGAIVPALNLPASLVPTVVWIGVIGFPCVLIFSWAYELTPEGLKRESEVDRSQSITHVTSKRLDYIIIGLMVVAIGLFVTDRFLPRASAPDAPMANTAVEAAAIVPTPEAGSTATAPPAVVPVQPAAPAPSEKSIAVLPFVNMSEDRANEYFSDGISEELLNLLAKIPELQVIARTSSFSYKGKDIKVEQIGQELRVAHVLEGSVRKAGNTVRITAQLVRTADSTHLWSETWDRPLDDIFAVQDEIAGSVVEQMKIKLLGAAPKAKETDPKAYALFLQARQMTRQGTAAGFEQAIALLQQALAIDPGYSAAWNLLGGIYNSQASQGLRPVDEGFALAREAENKALAIDPDFALAHANLGNIALNYDNDLVAAARHLQQALALQPSEPIIIGNAGGLAASLGRLDLAIMLQEHVVAHDPVIAGRHALLGFYYRSAGRLDQALASLRIALSLSPESIVTQYNIGVTLVLKGDAEGALAAVQKETWEPYRLLGLPMVYHALGRKAESDAALAEAMRKYEKEMSYNIAYVCAYRGEADCAFEWLEKAVAYKDSGLSEIVYEPLFTSIHDDPRWLPFLTKLGKAPEQLAAIKFDVKLPQQ